MYKPSFQIMAAMMMSRARYSKPRLVSRWKKRAGMAFRTSSMVLQHIVSKTCVMNKAAVLPSHGLEPLLLCSFLGGGGGIVVRWRGVGVRRHG